MCCDIVIASGSTLVYFASLSDQIVVTDIAPTSDYGMVVVDPTNECEIVFVRLIVLGSMVYGDVIHLLRLLDRPDEGMSIFGGNGFYGPILFWEIGGEIGADVRYLLFVFKGGI